MTTRNLRCLLGAGLLFGAAAGCSDQPREIQAAKPLERERVDAPAELPKMPLSGTSDSAAAKVVADALAAHTGGNPSLLDKLKTFHVTRSGIFHATQPPYMISWDLRGVWPDRMRVDMQNGPTVICRVGDAAWFHGPSQSGVRKQSMTGEDARGPVADGTYEWLGLLVPLAEPDVVFALAPERKVAGRPAVGVAASGKHLPRAVAHFDKETKLLVQFTYEGFETGKAVVKDVTVTSNRPVNGVTLPEKLVIRWDGQLAVEWTVTKVEFPVDLPPKLFEEP